MSQNQLATWLNEAGMVDGQKKSEILRKVQELLIHQVPHLLSSYLDNLLMYSTDRNHDVKKQVITFIEEISKFHPNYIPKVVAQLRLLLLDGVVATQKRVIQASGTVYKQALNWICSGTADTREMQFVWEQLNELKLNILNMIDNDNEGIRTNSIKFLEGVIILQTYSSDHGEKTSNSFSLENIPASLLFINRRKLEEESEHIFKLLLKFHNSQHISSVNLMACMTALCNLAKERPKYMPRVLQALGDLHTTLPPTLSQSQVNSVRKHLKMLLINLAKHPSSQEMLPQLTQLLSDIGMTSQEIAKAVPREKRNKRVIELKHEESLSKRPRIDSPQSNSQGSDKSEMSILNDDSNDSKSMSAAINEDSIFEGLHNIENVISLVIQTLKNLPAEAPPDFLKLYKPIPNSGSAIQKRALSKLIVANIKEEPTSVPPALVDNPFRIPLLKDRDEDEKLSLKNAVAKLAETEKLEREIENAVSKLMEESKQDKLVPPPTPTIPKLKQRVKLLKLQEITKPVPNNMKEKLMAQAVSRILEVERDSAVGGVCHIRNKLLVTFATTYTSEIRELILSHVIEDIAGRINLAISWLYEEYSYMQGFTRQPLTLNPLKPNEKHDQNYNNLLCALITHIGERDDPNLEQIKDGLLRRIYLETPVITEDAINFLKHLVCEEHKSLIALDLLEEIIIRRPPNANKYISALLCHTVNENEEIRDKATQSVLKIYMRHNESLKKIVEKYATLYLGFLSLPQPPIDLFQAESGRIDMPRTWNDNLYKVCLNLYLGLFPANEGMILELARVYAGAGADAKRCVLRALEGPMRNAVVASQGTPSQAFLELIEECPRGAETLITRVVHIITEKYPPSPELVSRVRDLYATRVSDIRFLIPVLNGLTKKEIVAALPKLIKLNPVVVKEVFNKLLGLQSTREENLPVSPSELLVAIHLIDPAKAELKYIIKATALCLAEKQTYTQEVLAIVLQQLMECAEIPVLLMRTVLQVLTLYPKLSGFIMNILQRLIGKQVWLNRVAWEGFIKCCERTLPQSLTVLLTLPAQAIHSVVTTSTILMSKLSAHVQMMTHAQKAHLQPEVLALLCKDNVPEAPMEVVNVPAIENFEEVQFIGVNPPEFKPVEPVPEPMSEPLPPGMD